MEEEGVGDEAGEEVVAGVVTMTEEGAVVAVSVTNTVRAQPFGWEAIEML